MTPAKLLTSLAALSTALLLTGSLTSAQAGTTDIPGLRLVTTTIGPGSPDQQNVTANCNQFTEEILGVGGEVTGGRGQVGLNGYVHTERPWGTAYAGEDADGTANQWSLTAYAICSSTVTDSYSEFSSYTSEPDRAVTAVCPPGTLVTGAGGLAYHGKNLVLDDTIPSADLRSVTVGVYEGQGGTPELWGVNATARCSAPFAGQRRVAAVSPRDSVSPKSVVATCPAGQRVIGTGHQIDNGKGQVLLDDVVPSANLTSVRVEAFEDQDGTTATWTVTAYAICANA